MSDTDDPEVMEVVKAAMAMEAAQKVARALKEKSRRKAKKQARLEETKSEIGRRGEERGFVSPEGIEKETVPSLDLCYRILELQPWGFAFDELSQRCVFRGEVLWPSHYGRILNDKLELAIRVSMVGVYNLEFKRSHVMDALKSHCHKNPFNPVVDYLDGLEWDGVKRIDKWLSTYLSAPDNEYTRAVGRLWLMAGVARVKYPGIKFDNVLILEGEQGSQKSSAFAVLGGEWYSDGELGNLKDKEAAINLQGVWIQEMAELGAMTRSDFKDAKAFFSKTHDKYRDPYGTTSDLHPRQCLFGGTDNNGMKRGYLMDPTGNRRYWPVPTGYIALDALIRDRDQLWAEAVHAFKEATSNLEPVDYRRAIELPEHLWDVASREQKARVLIDPWVEQIVPWLEDPFHERGKDFVGFDGRKYGEVMEPYLKDGKLLKIHSRIIMAECLNIPVAAQSREHGRRLRSAMGSVAGWEYTDNMTAGKLKGIGGYFRVEKQGEQEETGDPEG